MSEQNISRTKRSSQAIDNFSFDEDFLVKVTELVRRNAGGTAIEYFNPATEEKQDPTTRYQLANYDVSASPIYIGKVDSIGGWMIKQIDTSTGIALYFKGDADYATSWSGRAGLAYDSFNNIF